MENPKTRTCKAPTAAPPQRSPPLPWWSASARAEACGAASLDTFGSFTEASAVAAVGSASEDFTRQARSIRPRSWPHPCNPPSGVKQGIGRAIPWCMRMRLPSAATGTAGGRRRTLHGPRVRCSVGIYVIEFMENSRLARNLPTMHPVAVQCQDAKHRTRDAPADRYHPCPGKNLPARRDRDRRRRLRAVEQHPRFTSYEPAWLSMIWCRSATQRLRGRYHNRDVNVATRYASKILARV